MIPLAMAGVAKGAWRVLRAVPWWGWLALALAGAWLWDRSSQYDAGVAAENARWIEAQREADRKAKEQQDKRDQDAAKIANQSDGRAKDAVVETRTETAAAVERVRYETRVIEVPASCDRPVPVSVRDEFAKAIATANAARGPVRAGRNP